MAHAPALRTLALAAVVPLLGGLGVARAQDAAGDEPPPSDAPSAAASDAPPASAAGAPLAPRPVIVRPHLAVGVLAGSDTVGFGLDAGVRIHPAVLLYSASVIGVGEEYLTFSGVKLGYQHTLSPWFAAYGAAGFGASRFGVIDGRELSGNAFALELGAMLTQERVLNYLSVSVEVFVPVAPAGLPVASRLDQPQVVFAFMVNPIFLPR